MDTRTGTLYFSKMPPKIMNCLSIIAQKLHKTCHIGIQLYLSEIRWFF